MMVTISTEVKTTSVLVEETKRSHRLPVDMKKKYGFS
jgi:hypothetical protein